MPISANKKPDICKCKAISSKPSNNSNSASIIHSQPPSWVRPCTSFSTYCIRNQRKLVWVVQERPLLFTGMKQSCTWMEEMIRFLLLTEQLDVSRLYSEWQNRIRHAVTRGNHYLIVWIWKSTVTMRQMQKLVARLNCNLRKIQQKLKINKLGPNVCISTTMWLHVS